MNIEGTVPFAHPITAVWQLLTSPEQLSHCTPNLESWQEIEPQKKYQLLLKIDKINVQLPLAVTWEKMAAPTTMDLSAEMQMGSQTVQIATTFTLAPQSATSTELTFHAELQSSNPVLLQTLKQLAQNSLPKAIDSFFKCMQAELALSI